MTAMPAGHRPQLVSIAEAAERCGVRPDAIRRWISKQLVASYRADGNTRVDIGECIATRSRHQRSIHSTGRRSRQTVVPTEQAIEVTKATLATIPNYKPIPSSTVIVAAVAVVPHATVRYWKHRGWITSYGPGLVDARETATFRDAIRGTTPL